MTRAGERRARCAQCGKPVGLADPRLFGYGAWLHVKADQGAHYAAPWPMEQDSGAWRAAERMADR